MTDHNQRSAVVAQPRAAARDQELVRFLSKPLLVEDESAPRRVRLLPWLATIFVVGVLALAAAIPVPETAIVEGQIMPAGAIQVVQHLEGGIVAEILVQDGESVRRDQPLLRLDPAPVEPELKEMRVREAALDLQIERLSAFVLDREPDFARGSLHPRLVADQQTQLVIQRRARDRQLDVMRARIRNRQIRLATLEEQRHHVAQQIASAAEMVDIRGRLLRTGLASKIVYLDTERMHIQAKSDLVGLLGQMAATAEELAEAEESLAEQDASLRNEAQNELGKLGAELAQVREAIARLDDRVARMEIRAPVSGIVKGLTKRTVGGVVRPAEDLVEVVPVDDVLVAEVRIAPGDIGHVRPGQSARIEPTTYDASVLGAIEGTLDRVSASTFLTADGLAYYQGTVRLSRTFVGDDPSRNAVLPGMVVRGSIVTGDRSLLRFLLKPLLRTVDHAFHER
jgi:HlyD family secretion protein/adhesin transport system membrane fusion protein